MAKVKPVAVSGGQSWLAAQLGVSQPRVSQLVSAGTIARKASYGAADVAAAKAAILDARAANNATAGEEPSDETELQRIAKNPEKIARIRLLIERTAKIKLERELLAGGYVRREDVEKEAVARVYSVRQKLQELALRSALIAQKSEAECTRILTDWAREICDYYANGGN